MKFTSIPFDIIINSKHNKKVKRLLIVAVVKLVFGVESNAWVCKINVLGNSNVCEIFSQQP